MNAQFTIEIPDSVSSTLSTAECTVLLFNHGRSTLSGHYLAVGRSDGYITIWDIETKSVLRLLSGHVRAVTGLAWSSYNRYLASCSGDWNVIVWDLATGERKRTLRFDCAVTAVQFASESSTRLVVVLASQEAWLVDISERVGIRRRRGKEVIVEDVETSPRRFPLIATTTKTTGEGEGDGEEADTTTTVAGITAAKFTPDSRFIVAGTSKGSLLIFDASTGDLLDEHKVLSTSSSVKELAFDSAGRYLVVNCNDRALRILHVSTTSSAPENESDSEPTQRSTLSLTLLHRIQDMIQRTAWNKIGFSPSSDYIFAGAAHKASHNVYIYDRVSSTLSKILQGPKDWSIGVDWHPSRPMLASASNTGAVYLWWSPGAEIWSAYADGFEELEENEEYEEREDEFDFIDGKGDRDRARQEEEEAADVRIHAPKRPLPSQPSLSARRVSDLLELGDGSEEGKRGKALQSVSARLADLCEDSGWTASIPEQAEERRLEFTLLDDDESETFVIPPRLEVDYSNFHEDHF